ncbi:hypothetical protein [Niabella aurantiaca]|uniref:hypothetical protein n=1 Tax=Niabella aurantiaca TaxID=379900 RepID=UPI00037B1F52|nr:hypothetical protein [Niabella aurantiaca]
MKEQPFELSAHDLAGNAALDLNGALDECLAAIFPNYHSERFTPVTLKITFEKDRFAVVLYAYDHTKGAPADSGELPVKKFKGALTLPAFAKYVHHFSASFSNQQFDMGQMRVQNK